MDACTYFQSSADLGKMELTGWIKVWSMSNAAIGKDGSHFEFAALE